MRAIHMRGVTKKDIARIAYAIARVTNPIPSFLGRVLTLDAGSTDPFSWIKFPTVQTTDAAVHTLGTIDFSALGNGSFRVMASLLAGNDGVTGGVSGDTSGFDLLGTFKRIASGAVTLVGPTPVPFNVAADTNLAAATGFLTPSANTLLVQMQGIGATTLDWNGSISVQRLNRT